MLSYVFFFFNDTATTEIYTLSLHDALPISERAHPRERHVLDLLRVGHVLGPELALRAQDVTRLGGRERPRHGLVGVRRVERQEPADRERLTHRIPRLVVVE